MKSDMIRITPYQLYLLTLMYAIGSTILLIPPALIKAQNDGWISGLIGTAAGMFLFVLYYIISKKHSYKNMFQIHDDVLGPVAGKIVNTIYFLYFFLLSAQVLSNLGDFLAESVLKVTPKEYIHLLFLIPILYGARQGLEVIARTTETLYPTFIILCLIFFMFIIPEVDWHHLEPVARSGVKPILKSSLSIFSLPYLEMVIFMMILPHVNERDHALKSLLKGGAVGGAILIIITVLIIGVFGHDLSSHYIYPTFLLAQKINVANIFERVEVIIAAVWIISLFIKLLLCYYVTCLSLTHLFKFRSVKLSVFPLGGITWYFSIIIYPNTAFFQQFIQVALIYKMIIGFLFPLLLLFFHSKKAYKQGSLDVQ
ncbi:spore germination protein (plasmid) [Cytobacillus spongiae]|uniref:GerAB/ArcD/ProY family transporter n=1 Tax=Cytobacillus spongiae TaxID=2901381 RepID=UPI001F1793B3|nr:endospore germination permease [Cytobacillus spongiae]UII58640.1 spore germination protein [Cytobacillus spongiae]